MRLRCGEHTGHQRRRPNAASSRSRARASSPVTAARPSSAPRSWSRAAGSPPSGRRARWRCRRRRRGWTSAARRSCRRSIDAHAHIGYMRDLTSGPQNYTRENIVDHLQRYAYFGAAAVQAMGSDFTDLPYQLRDESGAGRIPDAARFLTAGRGLAPPDEVRPDNMRHAAYTHHDRAGGAGSGGRARRPRRRHRQDLGRRSRWRGAQADARALRGDDRRGASPRHARHGPCHVARRRQGAAAGRRRRLRSCLPGRGRRAARPDQGQAQGVLPAGARRSAPERLGAVAESGASAGPGNGVAGADRAAAAAARPPDAGRSGTGPRRLGHGWRRALPAWPPPAR